ncbi:MAG: helix-turn-helix transcriptional regulator [Sterolibacteriaceae bacterium MAG5]|nr:helix-turn-helix transcriptional regulator [Candidatus Nitricoxidireducens bremensis]
MSSTKNKKPLTARERECLGLAAQGFASKHIAAKLGIREATVTYHFGNAIRKLGAINRTGAVAVAIRRGIILNDET